MDIVVAGGSGLVGRELVRQLAAQANLRVAALVRRPGVLSDVPGVVEVPFSFDDAAAYRDLGTGNLRCDVLLIALGTTIRKAKSKEAFREVDYDYPTRLAKAAAANNPGLVIGVVSSIGADKPTGFYLRTKWEMEQEMRRLGVPCVFARPSLLLGDRAEWRPGEHLSSMVLPPLFAAFSRVGLSSRISRYRPITATQVATALINETVVRRPTGIVVIEGQRFYADKSVR